MGLKMNNLIESSNPIFSFIIPALNEEKHIGECLNSISDLQFDHSRFEVILVDNGSTDRTTAIAESYQFVKINELKAGSVGAVRNFGAKHAKGQFLVFLDADCTLDKNWLSSAEASVGVSSQSIFGGGVKLTNNPKWIEKHWLLEKDGKSQLPKQLIGASICIAKPTFDHIGGFNEEITAGEDSDFHLKASSLGFPIKISHEFSVTHLGNAKSVYAFLKRQIWQGENYLPNISSSITDIVFWITVSYAILSCTIPFKINNDHLIIYISIHQFFPVILTLKRTIRAGLAPKLNRDFLLGLFLDNIYLTGRSIGLFYGPLKKFFRKHKK